MLTMPFATAVPLLVLLYILWNALGLFRNYLTVRHSKLPVILCPSNPTSLPWIISAVPLKPYLHRTLPVWLFDRMSPTFYGWEFSAKYDLFKRFGAIFFLVTPGLNDLWIADPEAAGDILARRKDFAPLVLTSKIVGLFGPNLITSDGNDWQRQRRIIAPNFNEGVSELVWTESCRQANEMLNYFFGLPGGETDQTLDGLRLIAVHVIGQAGYGMYEPWKPADAKPARRGKLSYVEAVHVVTDLLVLAAMLPTWLVSLPIMPTNLQLLGLAKKQVPMRTKEMLDKEREDSKTRQVTRNNLIATLIKLSDAGKDDETAKDTSSGKGQFLTEEEISGNLMLFTVAGYDTTANTLAYAVTMLAAEPKWQEWLLEEIYSVLEDAGNAHDPGYDSVFPRLVRCRAYMFETLRLYSPLVHIARTNPQPQNLQTTIGTYHIPADTQLYIDIVALHTAPSTWGPDALDFKPTRWLNANQELVTMPKGTFIPWSTGPRVCPGQKMAQVEFVAVLVTMLVRSRVEAVGGVNGRKALRACMEDSQSRLTLQMNRLKDVRLRWLKR